MPKSVLLVDDEPLVSAVIARGLLGAGFEVESCANGEAALKLLQHRSFDLLLTDLVMPGMSGHELTQLVRAQFPTLPIIQMTGYEPVSAHVDGGIPTIMKPFHLDGILQLIARILGPKRSLDP